MGQRSLEQRSQELQAVFEDLLESRNVYYNPPSSVHMSYPAIVFNRSNIGNRFANNAVYGQTYRYEVTVIDEDPDSYTVIHGVDTRFVVNDAPPAEGEEETTTAADEEETTEAEEETSADADEEEFKPSVVIDGDNVVCTFEQNGMINVITYVFVDGNVSEINAVFQCKSEEIAAASYELMTDDSMKESIEEYYKELELDGCNVNAKFQDEIVELYAGTDQETIAELLAEQYGIER